MAQHVYHWKHGWIPLTHTAALSKAKGNKTLAAKYVSDAHSPEAGIKSRQHVAHAVRDLPNVPSESRDHARSQVVKAAAEHNAEDLLPSPMRPRRSAAELEAAAKAKRAEADRVAGNVGVGDSAAGRLNASGLKQFHRNTDSSLRKYTEAQQQAQELEHKAALARSREAEAARTHFTADEIKGATHVRDAHGWHEVVRVNGKTVTVKTPYSWTDSIKHEKLLQVAKPGSEPGKRRIHGPGENVPEPQVEQRTPAEIHAAQVAVQKANLQRLLAEHKAKNPGHTSKGAVRLSAENTPTKAEVADSQTLYGNGKEFYIQMRGEGKSHAVAMRMAADKYGRKPR